VTGNLERHAEQGSGGHEDDENAGDSWGARDHGARFPPFGDHPTNLRLEKKAIACWPIGGAKHRCGYSIKVTNTGPGVYHDHIQRHIPLVQNGFETTPDIPAAVEGNDGDTYNRFGHDDVG
jgi:hypothetical protein